jgi:hypothetical protein
MVAYSVKDRLERRVEDLLLERERTLACSFAYGHPECTCIVPQFFVGRFGGKGTVYSVYSRIRTRESGEPG